MTCIASCSFSGQLRYDTCSSCGTWYILIFSTMSSLLVSFSRQANYVVCDCHNEAWCVAPSSRKYTCWRIWVVEKQQNINSISRIIDFPYWDQVQPSHNLAARRHRLARRIVYGASPRIVMCQSRFRRLFFLSRESLMINNGYHQLLFYRG